MKESIETRDEKYERQTTEQFALLGRFVQAFELMVHWARTGCLLLTGRTPDQQQIMNRVFHNKALGAWALFEIWRDIATVIVVELVPNLEVSQRDTTLQILKQIATGYQDLVNKRNQLLHGTWHIGWANGEQSDFSERNVFKMKFKASGESSSEVLKDNDELRSLSSECARTEEMIRHLTVTLTMSDGPRVVQNFRKVDGRWQAGAG